jgi:hypothetical protein
VERSQADHAVRPVDEENTSAVTIGGVVFG